MCVDRICGYILKTYMKMSGHTTDADVFRVLADSSPRPTLMTNHKAEILYVNPAWEKISGYSLKEVKGKNPRIIQSGKTPKRVYQTMWSHLKKMKPFISDEIINRRKNGRFFNIRTTTYPFKIGSQLFYVQVFDDITKSKKIEQYRSAFIKIAAHDMHAPLASIAILSELLTHRSPEPTPEAADLYDEARRLRSFSNTLLDVRSYEKGKMEISPSARDLGELVKSTSATISNAWQRRLIRVHDTLDRFVNIDSTRMRQVIANLLDNALKHASPDTAIDVTVENRDGRAYVSVTNSGSSIAKKHREQIFKPFYKVDDAVRGYGLGLYIASEIIKAHKGRMGVESRGGRNPLTTFYFTLPLSKPIRHL